MITWLRLIVATLICALVPSVGLAQNTATSNEHETVLSSGAALALAPFTAAPAIGQENANAKRDAWQVEMDKAQQRKSRGIRYMFVGIGASAVGSFIVAASGPPDVTYNFTTGQTKTSNGGTTLGVMTMLTGGGTFWYGIYNWLSGSNDLERLDREGRQNGFLTLAPTHGGVYASATISF